MHNIILGKRNSIAQDRIMSTSALLAEHFQIDPMLASSLKVQEKDPLVRALKQREAIANLLDGIALSLGLIKPADVEVPVVEGETGEGLPEPVVEDEAPVVQKKSKSRKSG